MWHYVLGNSLETDNDKVSIKNLYTIEVYGR